MSRRIVDSYEEVVRSVRAFNEDLSEAHVLQGQLSYFRAWYYIPELDAVGPSKFLGYRGMTVSEYMQSQELDGRVTEPVLSRWFDALENDTSETVYVARLVEELLARYKKVPNRVARFNAPRGWKMSEGAVLPSRIGEEAFREFWSEVEKYPSMWDSLDLTAVAAAKDDSYYLLGLHCTLSSGLTPGTEVLFDTPDLFMVRQVEPYARLWSLLEEVASGEITLATRTVRVEGFGHYQRTNWRGNGQGLVGLTYPHVLLYAHGKSTSDLVSEADISRMLLSFAYRDIASLSREKLGFPVGGSYMTRVYFIAPILLEASAAFVGERLQLTLKCGPSVHVSDLRASSEVTHQVRGKRETTRQKIDLAHADRVEERVGYSLARDIDLPSQAESAIIWVFHASRDEPLYALRVEKPTTIQANPIWSATKLVLSRRMESQTQDAERILRESLGIDKKLLDPSRLEAAVHTIFACAGYSCVFTGQAWGAQGIDTIAFPRSRGKALVISVTTSNNIGAKIRTLLPPLNKLRNELTEFKLVPVIFSPIEPADLTDGDLREAAAQGVSLMLRPEIEELHNALLNQAEDKLAEFIDSAIGSNVPKISSGR